MVAVQPCALLLVIGPDWQVETVSANVAMLGDHRPASVVGQPLADLIGSKAIHTLRNRLSWLSSDESEVLDFGVEWGDVMLDIRATRGEDCYLIEAELAVEPRLPDGIGMVRSMSDRLTGNEPVELAAQAMRLLQSLTGFERVMICDDRGELDRLQSEVRGRCHRQAVRIARLIADRDAEQVPLVGDAENELLSTGGLSRAGERRGRASRGIGRRRDHVAAAADRRRPGRFAPRLSIPSPGALAPSGDRWRICSRNGWSRAWPAEAGGNIP